MSEQMTSRDIEDVLVSIRRLVTEDLRPLSRDSAAETGKLLLTPAHRVIPEPVGARPARAAAPLAEPRVDLVLEALGRALKGRETEWESETGDPSPLRLDTPVKPAGRAAAPHHGGRIRFAVAPADREVETVCEAIDLPEPEAFSVEDEAAEFHHQTAGWAQIEPAVAEPPAEDEPPSQPRAEQAAPPRDPAWSDAAEAAARAELEGMSRPERIRNPGFDAYEDSVEPQLDEESLREIVRAVLREELAGPLGERITRNIRKLVHQEIARALAVRSLD